MKASQRVEIFLEGAGGNSKLQAVCRQAFREFFHNAGFAGRMPAVIPCGSRNDAFASFETACKVFARKPAAIPLLLVDSEGPVFDAGLPWAYLQQREPWKCPTNATDDHAFLMVECMESWFLADREALAKYFGKGFQANKLPASQDHESIPKASVFSSLKAATRNCSPKAEYNKGQHSFLILATLDPKLIEAGAHAKRLFVRLRELLMA